MKKIFTAFTLFLSLLAFSGSAYAISIIGGDYDGTNVGAVDYFLTSEKLSDSGDNTVAEWLNDTGYFTETIMAGDVFKQEGNPEWYETSADNTYALPLLNDPSHFFIRIGTGGLNGKGPSDVHTHYLYENLYAFDWAVISFPTDYLVIEEFGRISHIGEIGGAAQVPEPSVVILMGIGLLGVAVIRRRRIG